MIKAIIFDNFGVLTTETWLAFLDTLPDDVDVGEVREVHRAYTAGFISREESDRQIQELTGKSFTEAEDLEPGEITKNHALLEYIEGLHHKGYKIGLLSNVATNWIRDSFLTPEEQKLFDTMVFSFEVGMVKPDPRIFQLTCERLGVTPQETILVDDIDRYCAAAKAEGFHTVLYKDFKQMRDGLEKLLEKKS